MLADRTLVNLARAPAKVHPLFKGGAEVVLHDGTRLDLCRRFCAGACAVPGVARTFRAGLGKSGHVTGRVIVVTHERYTLILMQVDALVSKKTSRLMG